MSAAADTLAPLRTAAVAPASPETWRKVALALGTLFRVTEHEVAIFRLRDDALSFLVPEKLGSMGTIPLSAATTSVAARTALTKRGELLNNFMTTKHISFFEGIKLGESSKLPIHKLMTLPILKDGKVVGVVQISRKAAPDAQVVDFTPADLLTLTQAAVLLAPLF